MLTLSGGVWDGDVYRVGAVSEITVQSASFPEFGAKGTDSAAFLGVFGIDYGTEAFAFSLDGGTGALSVTIPAGSLTVGQKYFVEALHTIVTDFRPLGFGAPDSIAAAGYEMVTEAVVFVTGGVGCPADLAEPFGILDLGDITAFVTGFTSLDPIADLDDNGLFDLADISTFVTSFVAGCP